MVHDDFLSLLYQPPALSFLGVSSGMLHALLLLSAALSLPSQGAMAKPDHGYLSGKQHLFQPYLGPTGHSFDYGGQLLGLYSKLLKPGLQRWARGRQAHAIVQVPPVPQESEKYDQGQYTKMEVGVS